MPTAAEAQRERADAAADVREEGAPVLLRFDRAWTVTSGRSRAAADWVDVETWALFETASTRMIDGTTFLAGDVVVLLADVDLDVLRSLASMPRGGTPAGTPYRMLVGDPESHPSPGDAGVVEYSLLRVLETVKTGGWDVLHRVQARG